MKHFTKQNSTLCSLHGKIRIQMNNIFTHRKRKIINFFFKKPSATKIVPNLMFIAKNLITIFFYLNIVQWALYNLNLTEEMKYDTEFWK